MGLLADVNPFESMRQHLSRPTSTREITVLLVLILAAAAVWTLLWVWDRNKHRMVLANSLPAPNLWDQLCATHAIDQAASTNLANLARALQLPDPLMIFLDPRLLEQACTQHHSPQLLTPHELTTLGQKLFGSDFSPSLLPVPQEATLRSVP